MKKSSIKHNSWALIQLDTKSKYRLHFDHREKNAGFPPVGSPTGLHYEYGIKKQDEKSIRIWGTKEEIDIRGELAQNADSFYYNEDGSIKFKYYSISLFQIPENSKWDVIGELTFMDEMEGNDFDGKKYTDPPIVEISLFIPKNIFDIFEKKYLDRDKIFFKSVKFEFGIFYDKKWNNKKQGRGINKEPHIFQTFALPITEYKIYI